MSTWNIILVDELRYLINDLDSASYVWQDFQLEKFLAIAAKHVITDIAKWSINLGVDYVVNTGFSGPSMIQPDPTQNAAKGFTNLIVLKTACIISQSELKKAASEGGWKIVDDKSTIDGTQVVSNLKEISDSYCKMYIDGLMQFKEANRSSGRAILSPYSPANGNLDFYYPGGNHQLGLYRRG